MPVRIPKARSAEALTFGVAGITAFAPFYMILPGANERLASQTARWAPRWERNINFFVPAVKRGVRLVAPFIETTVKRIDQRLPLEKVAKNMDRRIRKSMDRFTGQ